MQKSALAAALILAFCTQSRVVRRSDDPIPPVWRDMLRNAYTVLAAGKPGDALKIYEQVYAEASRAKQNHAASVALTSAAGCEMSLMRYRDALRLLYKGRQQAEEHSDCATLALIEGNISSIHVELGDVAGALPGAERVVQLRPCMPSVLNRAQALLHLGRLQSIRRNREVAIQLFRTALDEIRAAETSSSSPGANQRNEPNGRFELRFVRGLAASALDRLGTELIEENPVAAEEALSVSYRYRRLDGGADLYLSLYQLAKLKLAQHDYPFALRLIDSAIATAPGTRLPGYLLFHLRGRILLAAGDLENAVVEFRRATREAARWRAGIVHSDRFLTSTDATLQEVYDSLIESVAELHQRTGRPELLAEAWEAAETNRAAGLRFGLNNVPLSIKVDTEYWETLTLLRVAEARSFAGDESLKSNEVSKLRLMLADFESRAAVSFQHKFPSFIENKSANSPLLSVRRRLGKSETFMSFHLGQQDSYRWTITRQTIQVVRLPARSEIESLSSRFRASVEQSHPDASLLGRQLYQILFGETAASLPPNWFLALEGPLFQVPLAALVTGISDGHPQFLIQRNSIEVVPGAWALGEKRTRATGIFLGVGDAVYNRADTRFVRNRGTSLAIPNWLLAFGGTNDLQELPRLIGSGREVEKCARRWSGPVQILSGSAVTRDRFLDALKARPAVIHIAAHFAPSRQSQDETLVVLSLQPYARIFDLLTTSDVSILSLSGSTVVLSGCSSASGRSLAGAGLLGLTRAFLSAGATSVIASHWATPDDSGDMFTSFYGHLSATPAESPAGALRAAQLDMLHSSSWRSAPRYWAAFQLTGRSRNEPGS